MKITQRYGVFVGVILLLWMMPVQAGDELDKEITKLQHGWATVLYQTPQNQKDLTYQALADQAHLVSKKYQGRVEPIVWEAIVLSSYAEFENDLGALGKLKNARELLLTANELKSETMSDIIPMVMGVIYNKAPGWPISFGNKQKARVYLETALSINPEGMDQNFYYGEFLMQQREYELAKEHLEKALATAPRSGREDADLGRKAEINQLLQKIHQKSYW